MILVTLPCPGGSAVLKAQWNPPDISGGPPKGNRIRKDEEGHQQMEALHETQSITDWGLVNWITSKTDENH